MYIDCVNNSLHTMLWAIGCFSRLFVPSMPETSLVLILEHLRPALLAR